MGSPSDVHVSIRVQSLPQSQDEATLGYTETLGHPLLLQAIWERYRSKVEEHQGGKLPLEVEEQTAVSITACVLASGRKRRSNCGKPKG